MCLCTNDQRNDLLCIVNWKFNTLPMLSCITTTPLDYVFDIAFKLKAFIFLCFCGTSQSIKAPPLLVFSSSTPCAGSVQILTPLLRENNNTWVWFNVR